MGDRPADDAGPGRALDQQAAGPTTCAPVEEATWVADDGIRYLQPEIVLLFKARLRPAQGRARPRRAPGRCSTPAAGLAARRRTARLDRRAPLAGCGLSGADGGCGRPTPYAWTGHDRSLPRPRRDHADAPGGRRGDDRAARRRRQRDLAARLRAGTPAGSSRSPARRSPRRSTAGPARSSSPPAAPSPTTSRSRASTGRGAPPTRAAPGSSPPPSSTTPCSTRCTGSAEHEGAERRAAAGRPAGPGSTSTRCARRSSATPSRSR